MDRPVLNFFQVASLLMLLIAVALLAAVTTMHFAIHGAEVQVPALKGMTVVEARSQTAGLGLDLDVDNRYYSADVAAGHILSQSPAAGTVVRREWRVRVAESLGPQTVEVPDTVGMDERVAALKLRRVGLNVGITARLPYGKAAEGTVLAQDPAAHAKGIAQPNVNLLVAAAGDEAPDGYVMPDLAGMPAASAEAMLARVGIKTAPQKLVDVPVGPVGSAGSLPKPPVVPGVVMAQWPQAGSRVDQTTQVKLTVAK
jgi:beta-lactam-binding protein with PASTA domain